MSQIKNVKTQSKKDILKTEMPKTNIVKPIKSVEKLQSNSDTIRNTVSDIIKDLDHKIDESRQQNNSNMNISIHSKNNFNYKDNTFDVINTILTQHENRELVNHQYIHHLQKL